MDDLLLLYVSEINMHVDLVLAICKRKTPLYILFIVWH